MFKKYDILETPNKTEEHVYGEPVWNWDESGTAASADFTCEKCGHKETRQAETEETEPCQNNEGAAGQDLGA